MKKESKLIDRRINIDESVVVVGVNEDTGFINLTKQDETLTVRMTPDELKGVYDSIGEVLKDKNIVDLKTKSIFDYNFKKNIFSI